MNRLYEIFQIPFFISDPGFFLSKPEQAFLLEFSGKVIKKDELPPETLTTYYKKALIDKEISAEGEVCYHIGSFYHFMSVFIVQDAGKLAALPNAEHKKLQDWYFDQYYDWLVKAGADKGVLKEDRILPLNEAVEYLRETEDKIYLTDCECRLFYNNCERPAHRCLSLGCAPNSPGDRGYAEPVSKERAIEIMKEADKEGLMHTVSAMGVCNCCSDCCCMFQSQKKLGSYGVWPVSEKLVRMETELCVGCGICMTRCHLDAFSRDYKTGKICADTERCVGCGLCVSSCPAEALSLIERATLI